ncbi:DEAD/DEAH box helicase [Microbacterium foliorum]|uniref:ATP-dependent RNA helicase RhlE n=1 Tax=Microbacterium foliorum TaxID=104336 RepID=A0A0F0KBA7_9MICO|nr:DEAD/DEAH box helicase [Microbacterium foliorum]AXL11694.1 DEAD/DEAH box helicase [Microbacterium foliorum]KJL18187.1 ATP-dependent RNA helicase RhlE [Microbacterium foliorum]CAH0132824.1 ATP-dependent RNA helicase RhlE [Microbacterium foliorum]CAH0165983.1 ATP-dependent RNA helicase RhlE [Microbacterium foliorum]
MTSFLDLGVPADLAAVLSKDGKTEAFAIQRDTLPDSLAGRDLLGRGRTGSGKTIAFALPLVARLSASPRKGRPGHPRGLVLAPTRELATQIAATIAPLAEAKGLRVTTVFGGVSQRPQETAMRNGVDIVVACPGRLEDLMKQRIVQLDAVEVTVLDEADHMADLGFLPGVTRILTATPAGGQRLLFSATLDRGIDTLARRFLSNAVSHEVDEESVPVGEMTHRVLVVDSTDNKTTLVRDLASGTGRRILFTRTKHQAKKLAKQLTAAGIPSVDLHGNLSQNARERNLSAFSSDPADGGVRVLVATDVAARGVHVDNVDLVVHVDPPMEHKAYLHRSGRTARAGAAGTVVTVVLPEQRRDVKDLLRKAAITAALEPVTTDAVTELVPERAPHVRPAPVQAPQQRQAPKQRPAGGERNSAATPPSRRSRRPRGGQGGQGAQGGATAGARQGGAARQGGQSRAGQGGRGRGGSQGR